MSYTNEWGTHFRYESDPGDMVPCRHCAAVKVAHEGHGSAGPRTVVGIRWGEPCPGFMSKQEWKALSSGEGLHDLLRSLEG